VFIGPIPSSGCPLLSHVVVRITQQRLFTKNLSPRERVIELLRSSGSIGHNTVTCRMVHATNMTGSGSDDWI
jgi:hypothetical protein